jgi:hypothetical protein
MVTLTERAGELLQKIQEEQGLPDAPRLVTDDGRLALTISPADSDDQVLYHDGRPVLRVAADAAAALDGYTLAAEETPEGARLAIVQEQSPNGPVQ